MVDELKKAVAMAAVERVETGSVVGLGSGSTLAYFIEELGRRVRNGDLKDIVGVPTSYQARYLANDNGITVRDPGDIDSVDIAVDGADEVDSNGTLIKGAGAAHVLERLVASMTSRFIIVIDDSKLVTSLGENFAIPLEVIAPAVPFAIKCIREMGGDPSIRTGSGKLGPVVSDMGNTILDAKFHPITDPTDLNDRLNAIPGMVGHGLFVGIANEVIVAKPPDDNPLVETLRFDRVDIF